MDLPHAKAPILQSGTRLEQADSALVLIHGRGATAASILELAPYIGGPKMCFLAPQADGNEWYPCSFLEPLDRNEPWLSGALQCLGRAIEMCVGAGLSMEKICIGGFSQGACLSLEYAVRNPRRYGAVLGLSGGVIGPPGTAWNSSGSLHDTPVFLGCSDVDFHIPVERVYETERILKQLGAEVDIRIYGNMGHTVNNYEIDACKSILAAV